MNRSGRADGVRVAAACALLLLAGVVGAVWFVGRDRGDAGSSLEARAGGRASEGPAAAAPPEGVPASGPDGSAAGDTRGFPAGADERGTGAAEPTRRSVQGLLVFVHDEADRPVAGARVFLIAADVGELPDPETLDPPAYLDAAAQARATTDAAGAAVLDHAVAEQWLVAAVVTGRPVGVALLDLEAVAAGRTAVVLPPPARLRGLVIDGGTRAPIGAGRLRIWPDIDAQTLRATPVLGVYRAIAAGFADVGPTGAFTFDGAVAEETWEVVAQVPGYPRVRTGGVSAPADALVIRLFRGARARGRVVDRDGSPVAGVWVRALVRGQQPPVLLGDTETGADGGFEFASLPPRKVLLATTKSGYGQLKRNFDFTEGELPFLELVIEPEAKLAGVVVDPAGQPVVPAVVEFFDLDQASLVGRYDVVAPDGRFDMPWIPAGHLLSITAAAEGYATTFLESVRPDGELRLVLRPLERIRGRVVAADDGTPVPRFQVAWQDASASPPATTLERMDLEWQPFADPRGDFELAGVPPDGSGSVVQLFVEAEGFAGAGPLRVAARSDGAGEATRIQLARGGTIAGRVLGPDGGAVAGAEVRLAGRTTRGEPLFAPTSARAATDGAGAFRLSGIPAGTFALFVTPRAELPPLLLADQRAEDFPRDIVLPEPGAIEGDVILPWPSVESVAFVSARPEGAWARVNATVDYRGHFRIPDLAPGRWIVELADSWGMLEAMQSVWSVSRVVEVTPGGTTTVTLAADAPGRILGFIGGELGGVERMQMRVTLDPAGMVAYPDSGGRFVLFGVPLGEWRVRLDSERPGFGAGLEQIVTLTASAPEAAIRFELAGQTFEGLVVDRAGQPVEADVRQFTAGTFARVTEARTGADGRFRLLEGAGGEVALGVSAPGFADEYVVGLRLPREDEAPLRVELAPEARMRVELRDDTGAAVAGADVTLVVAARPAPLASRELAADASGAATFTRLPSGTVSVGASKAGHAPAGPAEVTLTSGETRTLRLTLARVAALEVTVLDRSDRPLSGRRVVCGDASALSDDTGRCRFEALAPGRCTVTTAGAEPVIVEARAVETVSCTLRVSTE